MKSFKAFENNRGYSFINGALLEVLVKCYNVQDTCINDILVEHRGEEYWTSFDNFFNSVEDYEKGLLAKTWEWYLRNFIDFENDDEQSAWVIKDNHPVRTTIDPEELNVRADADNNLTLGCEVPKQTFKSYERAMMFCDLTVKNDDGTDEFKESLVKAIKPTEEQLTLLCQLRELEKRISDSGLKPLIDTCGDRYFINTANISDCEINDCQVDGMIGLWEVDAEKVPFGYSENPVWYEEYFFYVKR